MCEVVFPVATAVYPPHRNRELDPTPNSPDSGAVILLIKHHMLKDREFITQGVIVVGALLIGAGFGHWMTRGPAAPAKSALVAITAAATPATKPVERVLSPVGTLSDSSKPSIAPVGRKSLDAIMKGPNSGARTKELEEYVRNLAAADIGAALKQLRGMPDGTARDLASGLMVAHWIETDPEGALRFAAQNHEFDYITGDVFQQLAADNAQSALARAQAIADPNVRYQALRGVLSYMADQDPLGALQLAGTLGPFANNEPLSQMIYRQWSATDPQAAAAQAAQVSNDASWHSPVTQVLRNWASQDPLAAIAWSSSQGDPTAQAREIGQIVRQWSRDDLNAAANWVTSLDSGTMRDAAVASLAFSLGQTDPAAALGWAQSISDAGQRENALQRLGREIMYRNPANGAAILQAAGIPQNMIPPPPSPNQGQGHGWGRGRP